MSDQQAPNPGSGRPAETEPGVDATADSAKAAHGPSLNCVKCGYALAGLAPTGNCPECGTAIAASFRNKLDALTAEERLAVQQAIQQTASCISCGYSIAGLPFTGNCPECGSPVADSVRGDLLQFAGKGYLETLKKGLSFVLNGILALVLMGVLMIVGAIAGSFVGEDQKQVQFILSLAMTCVMLAVFWGHWLFTELDPASASIDEQRSSRKVVRLTLLIQAGTAAVSVIVQALQMFGRPAGSTNASLAFDTTMLVVSGAVGIASLIAWAVQLFALLRYVRLLARRIPDAYIEKRTKTYMWLLPVLATVGYAACGLGPLIALVLYWNLLARMRRHLQSIINTGSPGWLPGMR